MSALFAAKSHLNLRQRVYGDEVRLRAAGMLTRWTAPRLRLVLARIVDDAWARSRVPTVVVDLRRLSRADDDAVTVLDDAAEEFAAMGGRFDTISPSARRGRRSGQTY
jgi:MFS superfamily sulfate permease-like transporter